MDLLVAVGMYEHAIFRAVCAAVGSPDNVMVVPSRQPGDWLLAERADTALLGPKVQQLASALQVAAHLHAEAFLEVQLPAGVVRVRCPLDFGVPLDWHPCCVD